MPIKEFLWHRMFNCWIIHCWAVERKSVNSWNILWFYALCQMPTKITLSSLIASQFAHFLGWLFKELTNSAIEIFADLSIKKHSYSCSLNLNLVNKRVWNQDKTNAINFIYLKNKKKIRLLSFQFNGVEFVSFNETIFFYVFKLCTFIQSQSSLSTMHFKIRRLIWAEQWTAHALCTALHIQYTYLWLIIFIFVKLRFFLPPLIRSFHLIILAVLIRK